MECQKFKIIGTVCNTFLGTCLYETICNCLKVKRIARKNPIQSNVFRSSNVELLYGETGIVTHTDNKIKYVLLLLFLRF